MTKLPGGEKLMGSIIKKTFRPLHADDELREYPKEVTEPDV